MQNSFRHIREANVRRLKSIKTQSFMIYVTVCLCMHEMHVAFSDASSNRYSSKRVHASDQP